jgi:hypothetical protein
VNQPPDHDPFEPPPVGSYGDRFGAGRTVPASSKAVAALLRGVLAWTCFPLTIAAIGWACPRGGQRVKTPSASLATTWRSAA